MRTCDFFSAATRQPVFVGPRTARGHLMVLAILVTGSAAAGCAPGESGTPGGSASGGATLGGRSGTASGGAGSSGADSGGAPGAGGTFAGTGGTMDTGGAPATGGSSVTGGAAGGQASGTGGASTRTGGTAGGVAGAGGTIAGGGGAGGIADVGPCTTNEISKCTGTGPIDCHFGGTPGNYEVTVELGGAAAGDTYVDAESYRRMLAQTQTTAGQTKRFSFVTNVRVYESEPVRPDDSPTDIYTPGIAGLDVYFRGPTPKVTAICQRPAKPVMVWIAGDSTVADQQEPAFGMWGQHIPQHFLPPISVANYADSGESSGSSLRNARLWGAIKAGMHAGDWVLIQFGHNDEKTNDPAGYRSNLATMVHDAKAVGANAVLITPLSRVGYTLAQEHFANGVSYPQIVRDLGTAESVPVIDLTVSSWNWIQTINWVDYFANGTDHTHTNHKGADAVSFLIRDEIRAKIPGLAKYLR